MCDIECRFLWDDGVGILGKNGMAKLCRLCDTQNASPFANALRQFVGVVEADQVYRVVQFHKKGPVRGKKAILWKTYSGYVDI